MSRAVSGLAHGDGERCGREGLQVTEPPGSRLTERTGAQAPSPPALAPCLAPLLRGSQREVSAVLSLLLQWLSVQRAGVARATGGPAASWGPETRALPHALSGHRAVAPLSPPAQPVPPMGRTLVEEPATPVCFVHDLVLFLLPRASEEVWTTGTSFLRWPQAAGKPLPRARGDSCTPAEAWGQLCQLPLPALEQREPQVRLGPGIFSRRTSWAPLGRHNGLEYSEPFSDLSMATSSSMRARQMVLQGAGGRGLLSLWQL